MYNARLITLVVTIMTAIGSSAFADGVSPWLPAPGAGFLSLSYVSQNAREYYRSDQSPPKNRKTPGNGTNLGQHTIWVNGMYGLSDEIAIDFRVGAARSYASAGPTGGQNKYTGVTDSNIGVTWRLVDELVKPLFPSIALRGGAIIAGSYETGSINAIGDGANGLEVSALAGKYFAERFAVSGEIGYRVREEDVPSDVFANVSGGVRVGDKVGLSINYKMINAQSGLQIGVAPFPEMPHRFPEVEEDIHFVSGTVNYDVSDSANLGFTYGEVIAGRNTAKSKVFSVTMGYMFDTF